MRRDWFLIFGAMLVAGALYNHYMGHSALLVELIMLACGAVFMFMSIRRQSKDELAVAERGLVYRALAKAVGEERVDHIVPVLGFAMLLAWSAYKILVQSETDLRMEDIIVTLFGLSLVLYEHGPSKVQQVKDFVVLYLGLLAFVFVVIWRTYSILTGESYYEITGYAEYYMVTSPTVAMLQLFGFQVDAVLDLGGIGLSNIIEYYHDDRLLRVGIGVGCSGLYSAGLFFSAFLAFVLVRYERVDAPIAAGLGIGFAVTWFSNIIRMVITVMAGIIWGHPALALVHAYIGIIIFVCLITVFWIAITRWLDRVEGRRRPSGPSKGTGDQDGHGTTAVAAHGEAEEPDAQAGSAALLHQPLHLEA